MINRNKTGRGTMVISAGVSLLVATTLGCESDRSRMADFFPSHESRATHAFAKAHAEVGARNDATLHAHHFDGAELNSLGHEKLDLMTAGHEERNVTIYMSFPENDGMDARRDAVIEHLRGKGFEEGMLRFVSGPNPNTYSPAAGHLSRMERTEGAGGAGGGESTTYLPASMTGGSSK